MEARIQNALLGGLAGGLGAYSQQLDRDLMMEAEQERTRGMNEIKREFAQEQAPSGYVNEAGQPITNYQFNKAGGKQAGWKLASDYTFELQNKAADMNERRQMSFNEKLAAQKRALSDKDLQTRLTQLEGEDFFKELTPEGQAWAKAQVKGGKIPTKWEAMQYGKGEGGVSQKSIEAIVTEGVKAGLTGQELDDYVTSGVATLQRYAPKGKGSLIAPKPQVAEVGDAQALVTDLLSGEEGAVRQAAEALNVSSPEVQQAVEALLEEQAPHLTATQSKRMVGPREKPTTTALAGTALRAAGPSEGSPRSMGAFSGSLQEDIKRMKSKRPMKGNANPEPEEEGKFWNWFKNTPLGKDLLRGPVGAFKEGFGIEGGKSSPKP